MSWLKYSLLADRLADLDADSNVEGPIEAVGISQVGPEKAFFGIRHGCLVLISAKLAVITCILGLSVYIALHEFAFPGYISPRGCGQSSEAARQNGCVMDFISRAWVHPDCHDEELEKDFLQPADWRWYSDPDGEHELSEGFIRQTGGPNPLFVTREYHDLHYAYTWRKLHRAVLLGRPIDSHVGDYHHHTIHCSTALSAQRQPNASSTHIALAGFYNIFTTCDLPSNFAAVF